jgi:hypothetical protein
VEVVRVNIGWLLRSTACQEVELRLLGSLVTVSQGYLEGSHPGPAGLLTNGLKPPFPRGLSNQGTSRRYNLSCGLGSS